MSDTTQYLQLPKPNPDHEPPVFVNEEFLRLREAMDIIDDFLFGLGLTVSQKAAIEHGHEIIDINGLATALSNLMPADRAFGLDDLTNVEGAAEAPTNYVLVKSSSGKFTASTALAALGAHGHLMSEITGLVAALMDRPARVEVEGALDELYDQMLAAVQAGGVPIGASILWNSLTLPTGFMKENGAAVSRTAYPELFAAIGTTHGAGDGSTTFNLPESRGEFFRGLDDGRGIDVGRVLGSLQAGLVAAHTHGSNALNFVGNALPAHSHVQSRGATSGSNQYLAASSNGGQTTTSSTTSAVSAGTPTGNITGTTDSFGGTENRSRNVSKLVLIRAF